MIASMLRQLAGKGLDLIEKSLEQYVKLETIDNPETFVSSDRQLMTLLEVTGTRGIKDDKEREADAKTLSGDLKSFVADQGHMIEFHYSSDPDRALDVVQAQLAGPKAVADATGLNLGEYLDAQEQFLAERVRAERYHIALWTDPLVLPRAERQRAEEKATEEELKWPGRKARYAQNPHRALPAMRTRHAGLVKSVAGALKALQVENRELEVHEAGDRMFEDIWGVSAQGYRLCLPGDPMPVMVPDGDDPSALLWPSISRQLAQWRIGREDWEIARFGHRLMAHVDVEVGPHEEQDFSKLRDRLALAGVPFRISMRIRGGGQMQMGIGANLAVFGSVFGGVNSMVKKSLDRVRLRANQEGCVTWQCSLATWVNASDPDAIDILKARLAEVSRCTAQWGTMKVRSKSGNPVDGVMSSALGVSIDSTAETGYAPLSAVLKMMPHLAASPMARGAIPLVTSSGALWPYEEGASVMAYSLTLIFAVMRSGKSALLFRLCKGAILASGTDRLPLMAFLDVGFSSFGLIESLREALPPGRRSEVGYEKLRMHEQCAVNLLDTPLGCRHANDFQIALATESFCLLATPAEAEKGEIGQALLIERLIKKAFDHRDDHMEGEPYQYIPGLDTDVDGALARHRISPTRAGGQPLLAWTVVDRLMEAGDPQAAELAQRYAVPRGEDLVWACQATDIRQDFATFKTTSNDLLVEFVERQLRLALDQFPICRGVTKFAPSARVVAMDLKDVIGQGQGATSSKRTKIAYTWYTVGCTKRWWVLPKDVAIDPLIPERYRLHHVRVAEDIASRPKYFIGDEWHKTESAPNIQEIVTAMGREGPKYRIRITLASQMLKDFTNDMIKLSSAMFVLSATEDDIKDLTARYNLTSAQQGALRKLGRRDTRLGQPIFTILNTLLGQFSQLVYSAMSPRELWTAATDPHENTLRRHLTNRTGSFTEGVALIADYDPLTRRPAKEEIEARIKRRVEQGDVAEATEERVVADIVEDILSIRKERLLRARR